MIQGKLYIVATPIGNMEDITLRALNVLRDVDYIIAEDTRVTRKLLDYYNIIAKKILCYNDYSGHLQRNKILSLLLSGSDVAFVSDAGTPLISDPGYKLIVEVVKHGIYVTSIPGACAWVVALTLSGLPTNQNLFYGFLANNGSKRKKELENIKTVNATLIFFENARRLLSTLKDMYFVLGNRKIAVVRELTKVYEEVKRGDIAQLISHYQDNKVKGEIVLVVEGDTFNHTEYIDDNMIISTLSSLIQDKHYSLKDAVNEVNNVYNVAKNKVYKLAIGINKTKSL